MNFFLKRNLPRIFVQARPVLCCSIALLAPFLGGSTERWAEGLVMMMIAALVIIFLPRSFEKREFFYVAAALLCLACVTFLPAGWFAESGWRHQLVQRAGIALPPTLSPQPWISAECVLLLAAGLLWICWLAQQVWTSDERRRMAEMFVLGAAAIAAVALVTFHFKSAVPFWHSERGFGPFPNRNQTGNFFAVSGILALACTHENFRAKKILASLFGIAATIIVAALVTSLSRAAVVLFFAGACAWIVALAFVSRSAKPAALCAAVVILVGAGFLVFGGQTLERFQTGDGVSFGFRRLIYHDALALIRASPWCGIGLGNFNGVFPLFRDASAMPSRILHPESDWLWLAAETGWAGVALVVFAVAILVKRIFPLTHGTQRRLRLAAAAAALVFATHGLVDVPGHRLGSLLPGLFVLGLALNNPANLRAHRFAVAAFCFPAVVIGATGAVWMCAVFQGSVLPGEIGVDALKKRTHSLIAQKLFGDAEADATRAIAWAPLDWELYFLRGTARTGKGNWPRALDDFRRVSVLESTSPEVAFEMGKIWLACQPSLAVQPWREALRRCVPGEAGQYFSRMSDAVSGVPELRPMLRSLISGDYELELLYLRDSTPQEFREWSSALLKNDPALRALSDPQKTELFRLWAERGDAVELATLLSANPGWQPLAWRQIAVLQASGGDVKGACETFLKFMPVPVLPNFSPAEKIDAMSRRLLLKPNDYKTGYALYAALTAEKNTARALKVLRGLTSRADCPSYFHYLEARLAFEMQDYATAWNAAKKSGRFPE